MRSTAIRSSPVAIVVLLVVIALPTPQKAIATVQDGMCWEPDVEFPVPCNDAEDD